MTGREVGFLLLGFLIGIIVTTVYQFIKGFVVWIRGGGPHPIGEIGLDQLDENGEATFRIIKDEDGNPHIVAVKEDTHVEDDFHSATNERNDD